MKVSPPLSHGSGAILSVELGRSPVLSRLLWTCALLAMLTSGLLIASRSLAVAVPVFVAPAVFAYWLCRRGIARDWGAGPYARLLTRDAGYVWTTVRRVDGQSEAWILRDWYRTSWLVVLYLKRQDGGGRTVVTVPRDAVRGDIHRRLRAMLAAPGPGHEPGRPIS